MDSANKDISDVKVTVKSHETSIDQLVSSKSSFAAKVQSGIPRPLGPKTDPPLPPAVARLRHRTVSTSSKRSADEMSSSNEWQKPKKAKHKSVSGKSSSTAVGLNGGDKCGEIFISHVQKGTKVADVEKFLTDINCCSLNCEKVSNAESNFDSFRVRLKEEHVLKLTDDGAADLWPPNVMCRRWYPSRQRLGGVLKTDENV